MRRADHSSRGVLPTVVRRCVCSINLKNEEAMTRLGSQRHRKKKLTHYSPLVAMHIRVPLSSTSETQHPAHMVHLLIPYDYFNKQVLSSYIVFTM